MRKIIPLDVVETIREGLLVLEPDLTIRFANRASLREQASGLTNGGPPVPGLFSQLVHRRDAVACLQLAVDDRLFDLGRKLLGQGGRSGKHPPSKAGMGCKGQ